MTNPIYTKDVNKGNFGQNFDQSLSQHDGMNSQNSLSTVSGMVYQLNTLRGNSSSNSTLSSPMPNSSLFDSTGNTEDSFIDEMFNGIRSFGDDIWNGIQDFGAGAARTARSIWDGLISQFTGPTNYFAHGNNSNCGPVALLNVARYFLNKDGDPNNDLNVNPYNAHNATHYIRSLMGNPDEFQPTTGDEIAKGAKALGLNAKTLKASSNKKFTRSLLKELNKGNLLIANVDSTQYGGKFNQHWAVIKSIDNKKKTAILWDPQFEQEKEVSLTELKKAMKNVGYHMVSVGSSSEPAPQDPPSPPPVEDPNGFTDFSVEDWLAYFRISHRRRFF